MSDKALSGGGSEKPIATTAMETSPAVDLGSGDSEVSSSNVAPPLNSKPKRRLERNASHQVYRLKDGSIVAGCSTICKLGGNPEGLIRWANAQGLKGVDTTKVRDKAADLGTLSHFQISCFLENVEPDMREYSDEDIAKSRFGFDKFMDFWTKERLTVVASEKEMVSELYRYGGTLDIVARDEDGLLVLLDGKSAKSVYWEMRMQLGGYESLWGENNEEQISRRAILRIPPIEGGEFQAHWFPDKKAKKYQAIFRKQAELYTTIRDYDKLHN